MEMLIWRFMGKNLEVAVVILVVLAARLILRRFPKKYSYALWSIVGIRMAVKLPIPSPLSVFNLFQFMASGSGMKAAVGRRASDGYGAYGGDSTDCNDTDCNDTNRSNANCNSANCGASG